MKAMVEQDPATVFSITEELVEIVNRHPAGRMIGLILFRSGCPGRVIQVEVIRQFEGALCIE
jgi:hypothetical protein